MATLEELKNNKDALRMILIEMYQGGLENGSDLDSVRALSQEIGIPYTCLRMYMKGKNLSDKNLLKVRKWVDTII